MLFGSKWVNQYPAGLSLDAELLAKIDIKWLLAMKSSTCHGGYRVSMEWVCLCRDQDLLSAQINKKGYFYHENVQGCMKGVFEEHMMPLLVSSPHMFGIYPFCA